MCADKPMGAGCAGGAPCELLPGVTLLALAVDGKRLAAEVEVARDSALFAGHFPGRPLLPGVVLPGIVVALWRRAVGELRLLAMERVKLLRPVLPGQRVAVSVAHSSDGELRFRVAAADGACVATGVLHAACGASRDAPTGALPSPPAARGR